MTVPIRVLIVDDTDSMRALMRSHVEEADGLEVVAEAVNGLDAIRLARETQPDAVILDVEMPVMDGLEALPGLLAVASAAKVVVFSSRTEPSAQASARRRGAAGFFYKGRHNSQEVVGFVRTLFEDANGDAH